MEDSILLPKQTFQEIIEQIEQLVKLLNLEIRHEEEHATILHRYDPTYIIGLQKQKSVALKAIAEAFRDARFTSSQRE